MSHRRRSRFRHAERPRFHRRSPCKGRLGSGVGGVPAASQAGRSRPRHAKPRRPHARAGGRHAQGAIEAAGVDGDGVEAIALDTTGSSVDPGGREPRSRSTTTTSGAITAPGSEAAEITAAAHASELEAIDWCGGIYSSEWGFSKLLHWLRHNPDKRARFATALEHCDMVAAVLCGITDPAAGAAQHLRHGPQVDVERRLWAACPRRTS